MKSFCRLDACALLFGLVTPLLSGCGPDAAKQSASPAGTVAVRLQQASGPERVQLVGLPQAVLDAAREAKIDDAYWSRILAVYVSPTSGAIEAAEPPAEAVPPMLGTYRIEEDALSFTPRFGLRPGMSYRVVFEPAALAEVTVMIPGVETIDFPEGLETTLTLPAAPSSSPTKVTAIYPSADVLPENQLKFYIHFSAPMGRGEAYQSVRIEKASGEVVPIPFLELSEELWDRDGKRFTIFFEPGRIKRGVMLRDEIGPALVAGEEYVLVVDGAWRDARGLPLEDTYRNSFRAGPADETQPDPKRWILITPDAGSKRYFTVQFNEPLDHAMLERVIQVVGTDGRVVPGQVHIEARETAWRFLPDNPWRSGRYELVIAATLEDLAGNSIGRKFEVSMEGGKTSMNSDVPAEARLPFVIGE